MYNSTTQFWQINIRVPHPRQCTIQYSWHNSDKVRDSFVIFDMNNPDTLVY